MHVNVRYFAVLRESVGQAHVTLDVAEPKTVGELFQDQFGGTPHRALPVMYAVNEVYVSEDHLLRDGDEVGFIPPLGGG